MRSKIVLILLGLSNVALANSGTILAISNVTVIDVTGAAAISETTVVISGDRITALGRTGQVAVPANARLIDATGQYLIPGLWDMHVHTLWADRLDTFLPLFIANGVTGVRDMYGDLSVLQQLRKEVSSGTRIAPHVVTSGPIIDGPKPIWHGSIAAADAAGGRQAVNVVQQHGADFVKVYNLIGADTYFAISDEARKLGIPFAGHVPYSISATQASEAGQKSIEHLSGLFLASSSNQAKLQAELAQVSQQADSTWRDYLAVELKSYESFSPKKADALFATFVRNGTWQTPTLTVIRGRTFGGESELADDPRLKYVPATIINRWRSASEAKPLGGPKQLHTDRRVRYRMSLDLTSRMRQAGVEFLAGTDTPNPYCLPGFSLHDELELLVQAGFTPMEALQAATRNPARFLGRTDTLGTVGEGKIADLVLLNANPLDDISNTRKISSVIVGGTLITRAELTKMLAKVEADNRRR